MKPKSTRNKGIHFIQRIVSGVKTKQEDTSSQTHIHILKITFNKNVVLLVKLFCVCYDYITGTRPLPKLFNKDNSIWFNFFGLKIVIRSSYAFN